MLFFDNRCTWRNVLNVQTIKARNPATLEPIAELAVASPADVAEAVGRARKAQAVWQSTSFGERTKLLYRLRDLLLDEQDKLADVLTVETGRPRAEAYGNELFYLCDAIGTWAKKSAGYLRPQTIKPHFLLMKAKRAVSTYSPLGVIGIISPWNFPLTLTLGGSASRADGRKRRCDQTFRIDAFVRRLRCRDGG